MNTKSKLRHRQYLRKPGLAARFGVSKRTIDAWRAAGILPCVKIRGVVLFDVAEADAAIRKHRV